MIRKPPCKSLMPAVSTHHTGRSAVGKCERRLARRNVREFGAKNDGCCLIRSNAGCQAGSMEEAQMERLASKYIILCARVMPSPKYGARLPFSVVRLKLRPTCITPTGLHGVTTRRNEAP